MGAPAWTVPGQFGPYALERELARGGQGAVFVGRRGAGPALAVKLLFDRDPRAVRRFRQEAQVLARLEHPHLPRVVDLGEHDGCPYLAMELIEGQDLRRRVEREGVPPWTWSVRLLAQVARALEHCHQRGVVHRDVKPANVVVEAGSGRPVLVDFGLLQRDPRRFGELSMDQLSALSVSGELKGTPHYMPPEQARGEPVGPAADVYALGATLCFLLTGQPPFPEQGLVQVVQAVLSAPPPDLRQRDPSLPRELAALCQRALAKDPAQRPPSALAVAEALEAVLQGAPSRPARAWLTASASLALLALLALLGGAGLALLAAPSASSPAQGTLPGPASAPAQEGQGPAAQAGTPSPQAGTPSPQGDAPGRARLAGLLAEADLRIVEHDWKGARELLDEALELDPRHPRLWRSRGLVWHQEGDSARALEDLTRACELDPVDPEAPYLRAQVRFVRGELREALDDLDRALALRPVHVPALSLRGTLRLRTRDRTGARADLDRAIELSPTLASALFNRGLLSLIEGDNQAAVRDLTRAIEADPAGAHRALRMRAAARKAQGDLEGAEEDLTAALVRHGADARARFERGQLRVERGDREGAREDLRRALELEADGEWAAEARALLRALE